MRLSLVALLGLETTVHPHSEHCILYLSGEEGE